MSSKKLAYIFLFAAAAVIIVMLLIRREEKIQQQVKEKKLRHVSFLDADPAWADSVLATMNTAQKAAQLFMVEAGAEILSRKNETAEIPEPGGFLFSGVPAHELVKITGEWKEKNKIPLLISTRDVSFFFGGKKTGENNPWTVFVSDDSLINEFFDISATFAKQTGLGLLAEPTVTGAAKDSALFSSFFHDSNNELAKRAVLLSEKSTQQHVLSSGYVPGLLSDTLKNEHSLFYLRTLIDSGVSVLELDTSWINGQQYKQKINPGYFLTSELKFRGIIAATMVENMPVKKQLELFFENGIGLIRTKKYFEAVNALTEMISRNEISEETVNEKVKKILLAKTWIQKNNPGKYSSVPVSPRQQVMDKLLARKSVVVVRNEKNFLPLKKFSEKKSLYASVGKPLSEKSVSNTASQNGFKLTARNFSSLQKLVEDRQAQNQSLLIVALNDMNLNEEDKKALDEIKKWQGKKTILLVNYSQIQNLPLLEGFDHIIHAPFADANTHSFIAELLFGNEGSEGKLPFTTGRIKKGTGKKVAKTRLSFAKPEELGFYSDSLQAVEYIMNEGIRNRAFPGGVVLLAKEGRIIYHKSFGHHTYSRETETKTDHLFDMASCTKIVATTVMAMHLYEKQKYRLDDSLYVHLDDSLREHGIYQSTVKNITFRELLIHGSGLPAGHNIIRFLRFDEDFGKYDLYFCDEPDENYSIRVAENFYLEKCCLDTIWYDLNRIGNAPDKEYKYSDANMNLLFTVLRSKIDNTWERYLDSVFYAPLGMKRTCFNPLEKEFKKEEIVPTEDDKYWREQLLQGYVHDPTSALYGGVAGNAGLFSTAYDMAILCQLWLNRGEYGGERYFSSATVDLFTSHQPGTHRGLGFNMQVPGNTYGCSPLASEKTYGHTGFTGTAIWVDPQTKIIFVFLTNRVHPVSDNKKIIELGTTKRVHNVLYELMQNREKQKEENGI